MAGFKNIGKKDYFVRYGYRYGIARALFMMCPFHYVKDYENRKVIYYGKVNKYLQKHYAASCTKNPEGLTFGSMKLENPIWVFWGQGIENAPEIVKACYRSIKKHADSEVILLSDQNIADYVRLPHNILEKNKSGLMSNAALADLIRFSLLEHFGGTWLDATVLLTGKMPEYVTESDFFAFKYSFGKMVNPAQYSNWLLHCSPHHPVMVQARNMAFAYWAKEKHVIEYLFTYILINIAIENNAKDMEWFPEVSEEYSQALFNVLGDKFDERKWKHYTQMSVIHKLTYKLTEDTLKDKDNFYHAIIDANR